MSLSIASLKEATRLAEEFAAAGAVRVEADILQPAETLLDLYGEDIRARAYVTQDVMRGEQMLRPDFTVPVVQMHMADGTEPARYTYSGKVFRQQDEDPSRPSEYMQVGYEVFDGSNPVAADANVFATIANGLKGAPVKAITGDIGILTAAVQGLDTSDARKSALMRHIWRPKRFRALLDRFSGQTPTPASRVALLASDATRNTDAPLIGLRTQADVEARIQALRDDAKTPALSKSQVGVLNSLLSVCETASNALSQLQDLAVDLPAIDAAVDRFSARLDALAAQGISMDALMFDGSYWLSQMEYYDGFVFGFLCTDETGSPVATGGRYDALTQVLGQGRSIPAVGGVIRPEVLVALKGGAE